jgi:hypothetical protein
MEESEKKVKSRPVTVLDMRFSRALANSHLVKTMQSKVITNSLLLRSTIVDTTQTTQAGNMLRE